MAQVTVSDALLIVESGADADMREVATVLAKEVRRLRRFSVESVGPNGIGVEPSDDVSIIISTSGISAGRR